MRLRNSIIGAGCAALALGVCALPATALIPGIPYYDYFNRASHPPQLLTSVELNHMERAETALRGKDPNRLSGAEGDLRYVLDYFPNHPKALYALVNVGLDEKKPQLVDQYLNDAVKTFPRTPSTWLIAGIFQSRVGNTDKAIEAFEKSLELDPMQMQAHYNLGLAYVDKKRYDLANQHAQTAYRMGAPLPGLREKLIKAKAWNTDVASDAATPATSAAPVPQAETPK